MDFINQVLPRIQESTRTRSLRADVSRNEVVVRHYNTFTLNGAEFFTATFHLVPRFSNIVDADVNKAHDWFISKYLEEVWDYSTGIAYSQENEPTVRFVLYCLWEDLVLEFDLSGVAIRAWYNRTDTARVHELMSFMIREFPIQFQEDSIIVLTSLGTNVEWEFLPVHQPRLDILENYNDDLAPVHQTILGRLNNETDKGIVLLHGKPGTGKTSYIRFLVRSLKKKVVFIPPILAADLTEPYMLRLMLDFKNSVLVIEDAENLILDRNQGSNSAVSALLNVTDGLLSDCLGIQLVCTFNTDLSKIDKALLRKGRLIARYEFRELNPDKATRLSASLGHPHSFQSPILLTDVYNQAEPAFEEMESNKKIGFR